MAGLLDDLFLQPDGSEDDEDEDDEDDDSDLELVEVGAEDPQGAAQAADLGELLMGVADADANADADAAGAGEERPPRTVADIVQRVAERRQEPKKKRSRPDLLTMAAMVYHFENMSNSKKKTAHT